MGVKWKSHILRPVLSSGLFTLLSLALLFTATAIYFGKCVMGDYDTLLGGLFLAFPFYLFTIVFLLCGVRLWRALAVLFLLVLASQLYWFLGLFIHTNLNGGASCGWKMKTDFGAAEKLEYIFAPAFLLLQGLTFFLLLKAHFRRKKTKPESPEKDKAASAVMPYEEDQDATVFNYNKRSQILMMVFYGFGGIIFAGLLALSYAHKDYGYSIFLGILLISILTKIGLCLNHFIMPFFLAVTDKGIYLKSYSFIPWENVKKIGSITMRTVFLFKVPNEINLQDPAISRFFPFLYKRRGGTLLVSYGTDKVGLNATAEEIWQELLMRYSKFIAAKLDYDLDAPLQDIEDRKIREFDNAIQKVFTDYHKVFKSF